MPGDPAISSPSTPPPSPPPHHSNPLVLYYGLVVVGTAATVLALYNLIVIKWCADNRRGRHHQHHHHRRSSGQGRARALEPISSRSSDNPNLQLVTSFRYKKGQRVTEDQGYESDYECPVCLSVFEEGEELRQLPRCKHIFHAPCIDMWLYSHFDCPVCRAPVEPPVLGRHTTADQSENSRDGLLDSGIPA